MRALLARICEQEASSSTMRRTRWWRPAEVPHGIRSRCWTVLAGAADARDLRGRWGLLGVTDVALIDDAVDALAARCGRIRERSNQ